MKTQMNENSIVPTNAYPMESGHDMEQVQATEQIGKDPVILLPQNAASAVVTDGETKPSNDSGDSSHETGMNVTEPAGIAQDNQANPDPETQDNDPETEPEVQPEDRQVDEEADDPILPEDDDDASGDDEREEYAKEKPQVKPMSLIQVPIDKISFSDKNPRRNYDKKSIEELAQNIRELGLLEPVGVRPKGGNFELVYGKRRYMALLENGADFIPAVLQDEFSDRDVAEAALVENLHREQLSPFEECNAFHDMVRQTDCTVEELVARTGFSETYIRKRMKLKNLIREVADLLDEEKIMLKLAFVFCDFKQSIQREVYRNHFADDATGEKWLNISATQFRRILLEQYSSTLDDYNFDKSQCAKCPQNTANDSPVLFQEYAQCATCMDRSCLQQKNRDYLYKLAIEQLVQDPKAILAYETNLADLYVVEAVNKMGYEIFELSPDVEYFEEPLEPEEPKIEDFPEEADYNDAVEVYQETKAAFDSIISEFHKGIADGSVQRIIVIGDKRVYDLYFHVIGHNLSDTSETVEIVDTVDNPGGADGITQPQEPQEPSIVEVNRRLIENLERVKYNKENDILKQKKIRFDNTVKDVKNTLHGLRIKKNTFEKAEQTTMYAAMLHYVDPSNYTALGLPKDTTYMTNENKEAVLQKITPKREVILYRDFIKRFLLDNCNRDEFVAQKMIEFARLHLKEEVDMIESKYNYTYQYRIKETEKEIAEFEKEIETLQKEIDLELKAKELQEREQLLANNPGLVIDEETGEVIREPDTTIEDTDYEEITDGETGNPETQENSEGAITEGPAGEYDSHVSEDIPPQEVKTEEAGDNEVLPPDNRGKKGKKVIAGTNKGKRSVKAA